MISIGDKTMPQLLLRYEDETEESIKRLQLILSITTKNKTIIEVIDTYENLKTTIASKNNEIQNLRNELNNIKDVLRSYKNAKTDLNDLLNDINN